MTSPRTLTAIASAAAALFAVASAHASTLYDAGLLSFESNAQSMWGSGNAFRKAESVFVGTEWQNKTASIGGITGSANEHIWGTGGKVEGLNPLWSAWSVLELGPEPTKYISIDNPIPYQTRDSRLGAKVDVRSSGKVGLNFGYAIDSGSVDTTALFRATAQLPDPVKPAQFFSIQTSSVFDRGTIATQSPKIEAYINPVVKMSGSIGAQVCGNWSGCVSGSSALPTINVENQRLLSIDPNSLKILPGVMPGGQPLAAVPILNQTLGLEGGVSPQPPYVGYALTAAGKTIVSNLPPGPTVMANLAEVTVEAPDIATRGAASGAAVTSSGRSDLLSAQLDLDGAATILANMPPLGLNYSLINTAVFKLGATVDFIDADAGPVLGVTQKFRFEPTLMTTVNFSRPVQIAGQQGLHDSWTGQWSDLPSFAIDGTTTFTPTFWLDAMLTNEFGLDLGLVGTLDVLKLGATASILGVNVLNTTPVSLNSALGFDRTLFDTPKLSFSVYDDTFDLEGFEAIAGRSFTVTAVPEPSTYAMLLLGLGALGATARRRRRP